MKNLERRVSKIEKLKFNDDDHNFKWFLSQCVRLATGATRGILPSQQREPSPEKQEEWKQLLRDYPEHAAKLKEWIKSPLKYE